MSIHLFCRYWIVLSLALLLELLLDQAPILKKSKALYIAYQAVKLAFVLWCLAPFDLNGAEVIPSLHHSAGTLPIAKSHCQLMPSYVLNHQ